MVNERLLRHGEILVQGDAVQARAPVRLQRKELIANIENKLAQRTALRQLFTIR